MPTPSTTTDTELTSEERESDEGGRRPAWWRRALASVLRGAADAARPGRQRG